MGNSFQGSGRGVTAKTSHGRKTFARPQLSVIGDSLRVPADLDLKIASDCLQRTRSSCARLEGRFPRATGFVTTDGEQHVDLPQMARME